MRGIKSLLGGLTIFYYIVYITLKSLNMEQQNKERVPGTEELTSEEIARRKAEMIAYFKGEMEFLTAQRDYQVVVTELEELRARQVRAQIMIANALAPAPEEDGPQVPVTPQTEGKIAPSHERKLRQRQQPA